jgi:hypothetical protein
MDCMRTGRSLTQDKLVKLSVNPLIIGDHLENLILLFQVIRLVNEKFKVNDSRFQTDSRKHQGSDNKLCNNKAVGQI